MNDTQLLGLLVAALALFCVGMIWYLHTLEKRVAENEAALGRAVQTLFTRTAALMHGQDAQRLAQLERIALAHEGDLRSAARLFVTHAQALEHIRRQQLGSGMRRVPTEPDRNLS